MRNKTLFKITQITDCETGIYEVGELDFGIYQDVYDYIDKHGFERLEKHVSNVLAHIKKGTGDVRRASLKNEN